MKTVLSIGEATLDSFMFIHDANLLCTINKEKCEFCMNYADKIIADELVFSVGGNSANAATSFARLGMMSQLYTIRGDDWIGQRIHETLEAEKIDCRYVVVQPGRSSYATALIFQGERNLVIYHVPREHHLPNFEPTDWVYLSSVGRAKDHIFETVAAFVKTNQLKLSFNPGTFQLKAGVAKLKPLLALTEALFVNDDEARTLTELSSQATTRELAAALYDLGPKIVNITLGDKGAECFDGQHFWHMAIIPIKVVERTGAGDAYAAGFTAALLHGENLPEAMRWGSANAASVVATIGPQAGLLDKDQLREMLADNHQIQPELI